MINSGEHHKGGPHKLFYLLLQPKGILNEYDITKLHVFKKRLLFCFIRRNRKTRICLFYLIYCHNIQCILENIALCTPERSTNSAYNSIYFLVLTLLSNRQKSRVYQLLLIGFLDVKIIKSANK